MQGNQFLLYLLLHLLSKGEPVALQSGEYFYFISENGVEIHPHNSTG
jgi:hypothetical protein